MYLVDRLLRRARWYLVVLARRAFAQRQSHFCLAQHPFLIAGGRRSREVNSGSAAFAAGHGERKRRPVVRGRRRRVRVTAVAKGPKVPVAGGGHMQSAIRHAVESFEGAVALRCVERRCDRRTSAAQNKLSPLRESCRQQEPPTGITSANATPRSPPAGHKTVDTSSRWRKVCIASDLDAGEAFPPELVVSGVI